MIPVEDIKIKYGTELAFVLLCCRVYFKTESVANLAKFLQSNEPDWDQLRRLSSYHRIEPVIYKILSEIKIPEAIASHVKLARLHLIQQCLKQALETERIIKELKGNGIECAPYKGVVFSKQFYGDIISRESSDIDLVISPGDFEKVLAIMKKNGYSFEHQNEYDYFGKSIFKRRKGLNFNRFENDRRVFHVEFHWRISEDTLRVNKAINTFLFYEGDDIILAKEKVKTIEANAHYTAVFVHHTIIDCFSVLRNLIDLNQAISNPTQPLDILYLTSIFKKYNLLKAATVSGFLSQNLFGVNFPFVLQNFEKISDNEKNHFLAQLLDRKMIGYHFKPQFFSKNVLLLKDSPFDKANYLFACLLLRFTPSAKDIRIFNLPRKLYFLYPILKPFRSLVNRTTDKEEKEIAKQQK